MFAQWAIEPGCTINNDAYRSYHALADEGYQHEGKTFDPKENLDHLISSSAESIEVEIPTKKGDSEQNGLSFFIIFKDH